MAEATETNVERPFDVKRLGCPHCGAGDDDIVRWDCERVWECYDINWTVYPDGMLHADPGDHLKHGDVDDTLSWEVHCNSCDYESGNHFDFVKGSEAWLEVVEDALLATVAARVTEGKDEAEAQREVLAAWLVKMEWHGPAGDISAGTPPAKVLTRLGEIGESESDAAALLRKLGW